MIKVKRPKGPIELLKPAPEVKTERKEALAFYKIKENVEKNFNFNVYRSEYVKAAIQEIFHNKCAYCESRYIVTAPVDVEHFRPKGAVVVDGKIKKPAYYWLASEWSNLLPSCIRCNRGNKYKMPNNKTVTMGKRNFFPLVPGSPRAKKPGQERQEKPLLLNPCKDDPNKHLEFTSDGIVRAAQNSKGQISRKGDESIVVYALSRPDLVERRAEVATRIAAQMERVRRAISYVQRYPTDKDFRADFHRELDVLNSFLEPEMEYVGMASQLTKEFLATVVKQGI